MNGPLSGRAVVVTRSREQAGPLVSLLEEQGAEVLLFPTIEIVEPQDWSPADRAIAQLANYQWAVFTSVNAVDCFMDRLAAHHQDARAFCDMRVAAVGSKTAERLAERGLVADVVPDEHVAEAVAEELIAAGVGKGSQVLLPRAEVAREVLPDALRANGAGVDIVPVYRNVLGSGDPDVATRLLAGDVDVVTFTSSSTVTNFVEIMGAAGMRDGWSDFLVASIGPVTTGTAHRLGLDVAIEPEEYTIEGMVGAIVARVGDTAPT